MIFVSVINLILRSNNNIAILLTHLGNFYAQIVVVLSPYFESLSKWLICGLPTTQRSLMTLGKMGVIRV